MSNPFFVLRVGTEHTRQQINEACDAFALEADAELYMKARAILIHPRNRIGAEIGWLPGVPSKVALTLVDKVKAAPQAISEVLPQLSALARCNLVCMLLTHHRVKDERLANWLLFLAKAYDQIDALQLVDSLNHDRKTISLAPIPSIDSIEGELTEHRQYFARVMRDLLDNAAHPDVLMSILMNSATAAGTTPAPTLIEELADKYQLEVQKVLDQLAEQIRTVLATIEAAPFSALSEKLRLVQEKLEAWGKIAQPIQMLMQCKGIDDQASTELANELRNGALKLANQHDLHAQARAMSALMASSFKQLPLFSQALNDDIEALDKILARKENGDVDPEWAAQIHLELETGLLLKDRLLISAQTISFNGKSVKTAEVDRVRWGGLVKYVNGIKSSSYHTIWIGSPQCVIKIECNKTFQRSGSAEENFKLILDKLWGAVGARLVNRTLSRIVAGEKIRYGDFVIDNNGVLLKKKNFFTTEPYQAPWDELSIGNGKGTFFIRSTKETKAIAELSYREVENTHILEALMRFLWKDGNLAKMQAGQFK